MELLTKPVLLLHFGFFLFTNAQSGLWEERAGCNLLFWSAHDRLYPTLFSISFFSIFEAKPTKEKHLVVLPCLLGMVSHFIIEARLNGCLWALSWATAFARWAWYGRHQLWLVDGQIEWNWLTVWFNSALCNFHDINLKLRLADITKPFVLTYTTKWLLVLRLYKYMLHVSSLYWVNIRFWCCRRRNDFSLK